MMFMCCGFVCCSFMFMLIVCMMCCLFQRIMVMAENCLVSIFSMQPANKSFVKVNDINRKGNYVQCVLHVQFDLKFIKNKDTDICKKYDRKQLCQLGYKVKPNVTFKIIPDKQGHMHPSDYNCHKPCHPCGHFFNVIAIKHH